MLNSISTKEIKKYLREIGELINSSSSDTELTGVSALNNPLAETIIWLNNKDFDCKNIICGAIIAPKDYMICNDKIIITVKNPRYSFAMVVNKFFLENDDSYIATTAKIDETSIVGDNILIGEYTVISKRCDFGSNVKIGSNVVIYDDVIIGDNVVIKSGTIIGSSGFGIVKDDHGKLYRFPHIGGVFIEDNVEIGANCCIDKGTIGNTIIKDGTKIDNLCHIAHNVTIGRNCIITAKCEISGSVNIGNNVWLSPSVTVIDAISIGDNAFVAIGTVVTKDVGDNMKAIGYPMKLRNNI